MRHFGKWFSAGLFVLALSSCNTSEALTPRADVGSGNPRASTPVTQTDADRMARAPRSDSSDSYAGSRNPQFGPQSTLEAQAQALQSGNDISPASSGPPPQWQDQQQDSPGQEPRRPPQGQQPASPATMQPSQQQNASLPPAGASGPTIRFLPIIGAPLQAVTPLSRRLGSEARAVGLTIRPSGDTSTEHILKGYFSAFADEGKVTIVYVWDVLDGSGARLHRMQGQESISGRGQDPWAAVPASTMETIATKTIQNYLSWRQSRPG
jgi:hypothetical protein